MRKKLHDSDFSLFSNDCFAGIHLNRLNLRFNSPTINLRFRNRDEYLTYLLHLREFSTLPLIESISEESNAPAGILCHPRYGKVHISFLHYDTFDEALEKWETRTRRIIYDNVKVVLHLQISEPHLIERFSMLPYKKIIVTYPAAFDGMKTEIEQFKVPYSVLDFDEIPQKLGRCFSRIGVWGKLPIFQFNIIDFLNDI